MFWRKLLLLPLAAVLVAVVSLVAVPSLRERAATIPYRVETWWHELQPQDPYVPPPRDVRDIPPAAMTPAPTPAADAPSPTPVATATPAMQLQAPPAEVRLTGLKHEYQGWNNCGPTTVGMLLSHYGFSDTQKEIAPLLKPNPQDRNVSPDELAGYVRTKPDMGALVRVNGTLATLKQFLANGMPVIVETWFTPKPNDGMGHYRLLFAYSEKLQQFSALDSYNGPNVKLDYADLDANWKAFDRLYIVAYTPDQKATASAIAGEGGTAMWQAAQAHARAEIAQSPDDAFTWFNLATALSELGRQPDAATAFDRARRIGLPWRMLWYQYGIYDAYLATGRTQEVVDLTALTLKQTTDIEEVQYYRGRALEALGDRAAAQQAYRDAIKLNRNYRVAVEALAKISP